MTNYGVVLCAVALCLSAIAVVTAIFCYFASLAATKRVSTTSLLAELDEIRDAIAKHSALLKRINTRTAMQDHRAATNSADADSSAQLPGESTAAWKARMRAKLIPPGKPARHQ